jgi:hypothetical protein
MDAKGELERGSARRPMREQRVKRIPGGMRDAPCGRRRYELGRVADDRERAVRSRHVDNERPERERRDENPAKAMGGEHRRRCYVLPAAL